MSRRWRVSGGGRSPRKRRASVASTARRSRPSVFGRWGATRRLSARGGGARAAAVDRDRVRASIGPPSAVKPHLLCTGSHQIGIAERGQEPCSRRKLSCATRSARCAMSQHRSAVDVATLLSLLLLRKVSRRKETLAFRRGSEARRDLSPLTKSDAVPPLPSLWSRQPN